MDKFIKFMIAIAVLLAGGGVFYHYVVFLPHVERAKQEQLADENRVKQEQLAEAKKGVESEKQASALRELSKQIVYEQCLTSARVNYEANWAAACVTAATESERKQRNCLADSAVIANQYMGPSWCRSTYPYLERSPSCTLPGGVADNVNSYFTSAKQKCMEEAKAGL